MPDTAHGLGLTQPEIEARRAEFGWNELPQAAPVRPLTVFLRQFSSFLVAILIVAAIIAFVLGERVDTLAIGLVVFLNAVLGFVQEWRAETALKALKAMLSPRAVVIRDGREKIIPARDLVPGDLIVLVAGDNVPADADLVQSTEFRADESVLTGESVPVEKVLGQEGSSLFAGTAVVSGRAQAVVTATGPATEFGQIAALTGSVGPKKTQLQSQLGRLARQLGAAALAIAAGVIALGLVLGRAPVEMFMTGLSLSVAMVPEGLPAVVTITLALGAAAMAREKALARRLQAVETLGAASVICTDKTGTLTENKMTATRIWTPARSYVATGTGYDPRGHIEAEGEPVRAADDPNLAALLETGLACTHAKLRREGSDWHMIGQPTEGALVTLAFKGWSQFPDDSDLLAELPFSSARKRMSVLVRKGAGGAVFTKGAPEQVLEICANIGDADGARMMTDEDRAMILDAFHHMASRGLRVIALAQRSLPDHVLVEEDMTFLGLVGMIDPPREEVKQAIAAARSAGIRTIMITGDSPITAKAIARELELPVDLTMTGDDVDACEESALAGIVEQNVIFARTKPAHKMRIISALQDSGQIVAMTGDGVNDAPALKQADIGVAMGIRGTDVAKDAADLVLLDDNYATIVRAIREGRRQFSNVQKFVRYLLTSNAGEVVALVINIALGGPLIFLATQILWMNLVTDGATAVALGLEKSEPDQMRRPPLPKATPILGWNAIAIIAVFGIYTGGASLWIFQSLLDTDVDLARTTAFTAMVLFEKVGVFMFRSLHLPNWHIGWFSNPLLLAALGLTVSMQIAAVYWPPLQGLLHTVSIPGDAWLLIGAFALPLLIVPEAVKTVLFLRQRA